jgi:hypothetical protein
MHGDESRDQQPTCGVGLAESAVADILDAHVPSLDLTDGAHDRRMLDVIRGASRYPW